MGRKGSLAPGGRKGSVVGVASDMEEKLVSDVDDETALKLLTHTQEVSKFFCGFEQLAGSGSDVAVTASNGCGFEQVGGCARGGDVSTVT